MTTLVFSVIALLFTGAIFGTVIRSLREKVQDLKEKGGEIIATDHTVILGWSAPGLQDRQRTGHRQPT